MISFIIPTKNEEKVIEKLLECVSSYSGEKEIILTDGKSTDRTLEIARKYTDKIVVYQGSERQTIGGGKNDGAAIAKGDFLVFLDADVFIPDVNNFFAKCLSVFKTRPEVLAMTCRYRVFPEMATWADRLIFGIVSFNFIWQNNLVHMGGSGGEFQMVRAEAFKKIGGFDPKLALCEDNDLFWRLVKSGWTYCESSLFIYHTGRRAHKLGWPKLLWQWLVGAIMVYFFKKSAVDEWKEVR